MSWPSGKRRWTKPQLREHDRVIERLIREILLRKAQARARAA